MRRTKILLILGMAGFVVMADNWVVSPILPTIAHNMGVLPTTAGLLITAYMIPFGLFQLVFGPLADRYGKRPVLTFAIIFFTLGTALTASGQSLGTLGFYRALTGIFAASVMPVSLALIGDLVPMAERQVAVGTFMGISFLGQGLSMLIGGAIAFWLSWREVFLTYSLLAAMVSALFLFAGRRIPVQHHPGSPFLSTYGRLLGMRRSRNLYLTVLFEGLLVIGSFSYLGAYIQHFYAFNSLIIGVLLTAFGVMAVIGGRLSGVWVNRLGRQKVLVWGLAGAAAADLVVFAFGRWLPALALGVGLLGLGFMLVHTTLLTMATEFAAAARGAAMSLIAFFFMGGGGIGTALAGRLIQTLGYKFLYAIYGVGLLLLLAVAAGSLEFSNAERAGRSAASGAGHG